jgi:CRISPR-associated protein Cas2
MATGRQLRILCYDISCDKRRRRVAALLEEDCNRVQESVFEARLTQRKVRSIVDQACTLIEGCDSFRVYTIGRTGEGACEVRGSGIPIESEASFWLL